MFSVVAVSAPTSTRELEPKRMPLGFCSMNWPLDQNEPFQILGASPATFSKAMDPALGWYHLTNSPPLILAPGVVPMNRELSLVIICVLPVMAFVECPLTSVMVWIKAQEGVGANTPVIKPAAARPIVTAPLTLTLSLDGARERFEEGAPPCAPTTFARRSDLALRPLMGEPPRYSRSFGSFRLLGSFGLPSSTRQTR